MLNKLTDTKQKRVGVRILYGFLIGFAAYAAVSFMGVMLFAKGDLQRWSDGSAMVTQSEVTDESLVQAHEKNSVKDRYYQKYTVRYAYTAEFDAWGRVFSFSCEGSNSGETDRDAAAPPDSAYAFPKQGDTVSVIYDPDNEGGYRIGSKEEWQKKGEFSFANLIVPCILIAVAGLLIVIDFVTAKKRRVSI
jgi:hypothetical protein